MAKDMYEHEDGTRSATVARDTIQAIASEIAQAFPVGTRVRFSRRTASHFFSGLSEDGEPTVSAVSDVAIGPTGVTLSLEDGSKVVVRADPSRPDAVTQDRDWIEGKNDRVTHFAIKADSTYSVAYILRDYTERVVSLVPVT